MTHCYLLFLFFVACAPFWLFLGTPEVDSGVTVFLLADLSTQVGNSTNELKTLSEATALGSLGMHGSSHNPVEPPIERGKFLNPA